MRTAVLSCGDYRQPPSYLDVTAARISADMSLAGFLGSTFYGIGSVMEPEDIRMAALVGSVEALNAG